MPYILNFAVMMKEPPYNRIVDYELSNMIKTIFCALPSEQIVPRPIGGPPIVVTVKWSKPPMDGIAERELNLAISDCLYSPESVYSDLAVLSHTTLCCKKTEESLSGMEIFKDMKLVFHLSKTLDLGF